MFFFSIATILLLSSCTFFYPLTASTAINDNQTVATINQSNSQNFYLNNTNITNNNSGLLGYPNPKQTSSSLSNFSSNQNNINLDNNISDITDSDLEENNNFKKIRKISVEGNKLVPSQAILSKIPYHAGKLFNPLLSNKLINNVYDLGYFNLVELSIEENPDDTVDLFVIVKEKPKVESIVYENATHVSPDDIEKKLKLSEVSSMDQEEAELYAEKIKKLYAEKNYHEVQIETKLEPTPNGNVTVIFNINEGPKSVVKRVRFVGNHAFSSKKLSGLIFTREDWILGFMNKAGSFQPEALEYDKYMIETFYQNHGYLAAKVTDVKVEPKPDSGNLQVVFYIEEGDIYDFGKIDAEGNDLISSEQILQALPIRTGQLYSREVIRTCIEILQTTWGTFGYINSDVDPEVIPNFENKTVDIIFHSDLGKKVKLRRINIVGNTKTRDYVIRRKLELEEGQIIKGESLEKSKSEIEKLGFFEPKEGVAWKTTKIDEGTVDLDLVLQEVKTGRIYANVGYGGNQPNVPNSSVTVTLGVNERNLFGTGIITNLNLTFSKQNRSAEFSIFNPWLLGYPIGSGIDAYHRKIIYEDFNSEPIPIENRTGGVGILNIAPWSNPSGLPYIFNLGYENINFIQRPRGFEGRFDSGNSLWLALSTGLDLRNNPVFPTKGYSWQFNSKVAIPSAVSLFGYGKVDVQATWLTPIIGDYKLVFLLHGHGGIIEPIRNNPIPYGELYHVGGMGTVRGFTYGQIGPQFAGSSLGAKKAFWVNAELIFSVTDDRSIRGVVFYDGGAAWDTTRDAGFDRLLLNREQSLLLINNNFKYRHAIGFGVRLTQPSPIRIDWAFKLDRNKRLGEKIMEIHFTMMQDF